MTRDNTTPPHLRRLKTAEIILLIILMVSAVAITLNYSILPSFGINVTASTSGDSMYPVMKEGALVIWYDSSRVPFEDVEAGDIIIFRERDDAYNLTGSESATLNFHKGRDSNTETTEAASETTPSDTPETIPEPQVSYHDSGIAYVDDSVIMHRAVEIIEATDTSDRAIITEGDGNGYRDQSPVLKSGYAGKVIWHKNYIGWPYRIISYCKGLLWLLGAAAILGAVIFFIYRREK